MMKRKPRVAVFFGGNSDTRDLSVETGHWISQYIPRSHYEVIPVNINPDDTWQVPLGSLPSGGSAPRMINMLQAAVPALPAAAAIPRLLARQPDIFFTLLRGKGGDDGSIQALAHLAGIAAVGSSPLTCAITADKIACAHAISNIALTPFAIPVKANTRAADAAAQLPEDIAFPLFVKPVSAEGSTGVQRIEASADLPGAIAAAQVQGDILVQEAQAGVEFNVTVYQDDSGKVRVLPPTIVQPIKATFFDALSKRRAGRVRLVSADVANETTQQVMTIVRDIYTLLACRGVVTVDLISHGRDIDVLEVNTVPTATAHTPLSSQLKAAGIHPSQFVDSVVKEALSR